jgi:hypothetical protein
VKRVGPELKIPKREDLKVPPVLSDLYWDLRDRRLLPLVGLLIVAIIAAPILLGNKSSSSSGPTAAPRIGGTAGASGGDRLTVVAAQPGLRNPKKRFAHRKPTNPFKQRFTAPQVANAEENAVETVETAATTELESSPSGGSPSEGTTIEETTVVTPLPESTPTPTQPSNPTEPSGPGPRGGGKAGGEGGNSEGGSSSEANSPTGPEGGELRYYGWSAKLQIAHTEGTAEGAAKMGEPEVRDAVKAPAPLPGRKKPVVTFIGVDTATENALFIVSKGVTAMSGEGKCVSGTDTCELVELEVGFPETFEYGPVHERWKINLVSIQMFRIKDPSPETTSARTIGATQAVTRR